MRSIRINVHDERTNIIEKERNQKNVSVVNYVSTKGKMKRGEINVDVS